MTYYYARNSRTGIRASISSNADAPGCDTILAYRSATLFYDIFHCSQITTVQNVVQVIELTDSYMGLDRPTQQQNAQRMRSGILGSILADG